MPMCEGSFDETMTYAHLNTFKDFTSSNASPQNTLRIAGSCSDGHSHVLIQKSGVNIWSFPVKKKKEIVNP